ILEGLAGVDRFPRVGSGRDTLDGRRINISERVGLHARLDSLQIKEGVGRTGEGEWAAKGEVAVLVARFADGADRFGTEARRSGIGCARGSERDDLNGVST